MMKYHNKKVEYVGRLFDSKAEADFYRFLLEKVKPVEIICQPTVELQPSFKKDGKTVRAITYTPDFFVKFANGKEVYVDVKGMSTQQGELKRKIWWYKYPNKKLIWVATSKKYSLSGWIEWGHLNKQRRLNRKAKK